jgi:hypothetical protein
MGRQPAPPPALLRPLLAVLAESDVRNDENIVAGTRLAALQLLSDIVVSGDASRATAVRLLVADSLITWSCEAACIEPDTLDRVASDTIRAVVGALHHTRSGVAEA